MDHAKVKDQLNLAMKWARVGSSKAVAARGAIADIEKLADSAATAAECFEEAAFQCRQVALGIWDDE